MDEITEPKTEPYVTPEGDEGLKVTFKSGRTVFVLPATLIASYRKRRLAQEAINNPSRDIDEMSLRVFFYPAMAACSSGDVPTEEEFLKLRGFTERDMDEWYKAVNKINPQFFPDEREAQKKILSELPATPPKKSGRKKKH